MRNSGKFVGLEVRAMRDLLTEGCVKKSLPKETGPVPIVIWPRFILRTPTAMSIRDTLFFHDAIPPPHQPRECRQTKYPGNERPRRS